VKQSIVLFGVLTAGMWSRAVPAQDCYPAYRVVYRTVYDEQRVVTHRLTYETALEERQVTTMKPEWVTETRQRTLRVAKPVLETSTRNEVYRVSRPVLETETRYEQHVVRRPVTETIMQDQNYLTYEPVTTMRTEYVDRGGFVDQLVYSPGPVRNRLQWLPGAYFVDPRTGTQVYHRGGLHWVPQQGAGSYSVARQYVPNVVTQQVPQTSYVQKLVSQPTPVQVTRYVDEVVQRPVQVQVQKWVTEEVTRPVTVTTQKYEYEDRIEDYQVQKLQWVSEMRTVQVPHTVARWVPYTTTRLVPRTEVERVPLDPCLPCTPAVGATSYYVPVDPPSSSVVKREGTAKDTAAEKKPTEATPKDQPTDQDEMDPPALKKAPDLNSASGPGS
jgi:hypothetical protein